MEKSDELSCRGRSIVASTNGFSIGIALRHANRFDNLK
jgi:hypothetical protein